MLKVNTYTVVGDYIGKFFVCIWFCWLHQNWPIVITKIRKEHSKFLVWRLHQDETNAKQSILQALERAKEWKRGTRDRPLGTQQCKWLRYNSNNNESEVKMSTAVVYLLVGSFLVVFLLNSFSSVLFSVNVYFCISLPLLSSPITYFAHFVGFLWVKFS